jgi:hypothetical protein
VDARGISGAVPPFGFCVEETPEGLRYRRDAPPVDEMLEQLRRAGVLDEDHFD